MPKPPADTNIAAALRRLRLPLAAVVGLIFSLTRLAEMALVGLQPELPMVRTLDALFWGFFAACAIYALISWVLQQERRFRRAEADMLDELLSANARLELLYELNQRIASSATLDEVLDYGITLPTRLVGAQAAALVLFDEQGEPQTARCTGMAEEQLVLARASFGLQPQPANLKTPHAVLRSRTTLDTSPVAVVVPIVEREQRALGWIEAFVNEPSRLDGRIQNERLPSAIEALLVTVGGELAEAVQNSRRRARELASLAALEQAITEERTRIARDLHDGVAQSLAFLRMRVDLWEDFLAAEPQRLPEEFKAVKATLRHQIEELRRAIYALRPLELTQLGFAGALRRFVADFAEQQDWELDLSLGTLPPDVPHALELAAFRFVQEALNNAAKHANARRVAVILRAVDGGLQIAVRDDGVGFDPGANAELPRGSLGVRQMRERAAALDGHVTILSRPGQGTEVRVWLPLLYAVPVV
jgi:signal transduction histidine kinase